MELLGDIILGSQFSSTVNCKAFLKLLCLNVSDTPEVFWYMVFKYNRNHSKKVEY